ncbi:MAG TPA: DUF542 domain-containing protein [Thermoanaerobaculia bacterium]|nr:DUF542 domain-containing protein [Thermoanaerobaculia bacterium]
MTSGMTVEMTVAEAIASHPHAAVAFEVLGVDYCCDGGRTLREAAAAASIDPGELLGILKGAAPPSLPAAPSPPDAPLDQITSLLGDIFHRRARAALVRLVSEARRLGSGHAARHPELLRVRTAVEHLAHDLVPHMAKEEQYLFPYIDGMVTGRFESTQIVPLFGTVEYPLQFIRHDHAEDLHALGELSQLTRRFQPPEGACDRMRAFYADLAEFASELERHIHLENGVLFPRAVEMEKKRAQR